MGKIRSAYLILNNILKENYHFRGAVVCESAIIEMGSKVRLGMLIKFTWTIKEIIDSLT
jgi:hypothetical protein